MFGAVHHFGLADLVVVRVAGARLDMHLVEVKYHDLEGEKKFRRGEPSRHAIHLCHVSSDATVSCDLTAYKPQDKDDPDGC